MATAQLNGVIRHIRRLAQDVGGMTDGQLLERFRTHQDQVAFEGLVRRLGPMVLGVCRRVLRDRHDAEDAFQATFLVLVRKAPSIARPELVGNWLYGVAFLTAQNARANRARRRAAERQVQDMPDTRTVTDPVRSDLQSLLDEELSRLPERYRAPVVLCELHGKSRREAARQLGCAEGTLSSRLARARQLLRKRLSRRGMVLSAAALAGALSPAAASAAVPASLVNTMVMAATQVAAGQAAASAGVSAPVAALTEGVIKVMFLSKLKMVTVVFMVIGLMAGGAGMFVRQALAGKPAAAVQKEKGAAPAADDTKKEKKEQGPSVQGIVKAIDAAKSTIAVAVRIEGTKQTEDKTFDLARDVRVLLNNSLSKDQPPEHGKPADLTEGTSVTLELAPDKKAVVTITARGAKLQGVVKAVDAAKNTLTVAVKEGKGATETTVELVKDARIILSDGLKKGEQGQEGKLADLTPGTTAALQLTVDRSKALAVHVHGLTVQGEVKGVDAGNNTITLTLKKDGQVVDKTFTLHKDARLEGKLSDLTQGTMVVLQLSVVEKDSVVVVRRQEGKKKEKDEQD